MRISGTPTIINGILTLADTEYEIALPKNCHQFSIRSRYPATIQLAYVAGESNTSFITVTSGLVYWESALRVNTSLYIRSSIAGTIAEVVAWSGGDDL